MYICIMKKTYEDKTLDSILNWNTILTMVNDYPNDMDLGNKVRLLVNKEIKEKKEHIMLYENGC